MRQTDRDDERVRRASHVVTLLAAICAIACRAQTSAAPPDAIVSDDTGGADTTPLPPDPATPSDKLDVLFVIDNSISMEDKQRELARSVAGFVKRLTNPDDSAAKRVADLHVGVITSSLGSHGTSACDPSVASSPHVDDKAHLLPRDGEVPTGKLGWTVAVDGDPPVAATCPAIVAASPVSWVFDPAADPGATFSGVDGTSSMQSSVSCIIQSAKEDGCGYEETLEAAYRFLIDPAPYVRAEVKCTFGVSGDACGSNKIVVSGVDSELLAQRAAFLRPDSSLVVVVLSDENDASLKPASLNWLPWATVSGKMMRGWAACDGVPDDFEPESAAEYDDLHVAYKCFSCYENAADARCSFPWPTAKVNEDPDGRNLRAFHQVQRFGYNFLWSRNRYVSGFSSASAIGSDGKVAANPVFAGGRTRGNILFAAIVGVPTALAFDDPSTPKAMSEADWDRIVGPKGVRDPHMIESIAPRAGIPKFVGNRTIDPMNGGDRDVANGDDLQYACIAKRAIDTATDDCTIANADKKNPICGVGGTQPYFKAYPGLRHLRVARALGPQGFVASICTNSLASTLDALVARIQPMLR